MNVALEAEVSRSHRHERPRVGRSPGLLLGMALSIVAIAALAYWDERRESAAALDEFAEEQNHLATAAGATLATLLASSRRDAMALGLHLRAAHMESSAPDAPVSVTLRPASQSPPDAVDDGRSFRFSFPFDAEVRVDAVVSAPHLLASLQAIEHAGAVVLLVKRAGHRAMVTSRGEIVVQNEIEDAIGRGAAWLRLGRPEAASLGLPARAAMAGLRSVDAGDLGQWGVAVVATAERERDRGQRAQWRLLLGVALASGLVLAFGGVALRKQRRQLELERELAVAEVQHERDESLVRADKLATMGALATGIAHEVSTPLGVIMGRAEQLIPKVAGDERAKRALDVILEQSERISQVVRGFLRLARGGSPSLEQVDPDALARNAIELVEHRFEKARVRLVCDVAPNIPRVACEPRLFEQALVNLLLNACDACEAAGGTVELRVRADEQRVAFVVVDDGEGITPEAAARAAEPFFTTKPPGEGTGLGLAITTEIVKHHQGTLTLGPRAASTTGAPPSSLRPGVRGTRACVEISAVKDVS